jgi:pimeloyl-ACP methyl ester carboxylesterase
MTAWQRDAQGGEASGLHAARSDVLLVMVPGMGMREGDFVTEGLVDAVERRHWPVTIATVDPGLDAYLDGSIETRLLHAIADARHAAGSNRIWLAGISLGCQAILRCVRKQPGLAEGLILLTPYLASTGLIAEVGRAGGLRRWSATNTRRDEPESALLTWLAATPRSELPRILVGRALADRFVATAAIFEELLHPNEVTSVPGEHDWASWRALWRLILDQHPFERQAAAAP